MPVAALKQFLDDHHVRYVSIAHSPAYTAQEAAHCAHVCGKTLAKTVIILMDGGMAMVAMPATSRIRWDRFMAAMGTDFIELADEDDFRDRFPDCEVGAMPPFGHLYGLPLYMDETLTRQEQLCFSAGSHSELIKLDMADYQKLARPVLLDSGFAPIARRPLQRKPRGASVLSESGARDSAQRSVR